MVEQYKNGLENVVTWEQIETGRASKEVSKEDLSGTMRVAWRCLSYCVGSSFIFCCQNSIITL